MMILGQCQRQCQPSFSANVGSNGAYTSTPHPHSGDLSRHGDHAPSSSDSLRAVLVCGSYPPPMVWVAPRGQYQVKSNIQTQLMGQAQPVIVHGGRQRGEDGHSWAYSPSVSMREEQEAVTC
jgi:hypothetical protein